MVISVTSCHRVTLSGTLEPRAAFLYISLEHRNFSISHWAKLHFKMLKEALKKLTQMLNKIIMQSMLKNLSKCEVKA